MNQTSIYESIAKAALERYHLSQAKYHFLGHSENATFRVETPEQKFLLRIHRSVSEPQADLWQQPAAIESELQWLTALARDTELVVQTPVKNDREQWVTQVSLEDNAESFNCSLLNWIDGETIQSDMTSQQAFQLGVVMARLHQHGQQWQLPANFTRPDYDFDRFANSLSKLHPAGLPGLISDENYRVLAAAAERVQHLMERLERTQDSWGLIHADLHNENYLASNEKLHPIDFGRCGFGYYLYDVADSLQYLPPTLRGVFVEGYQTLCQLPDNYVPIVEGFFISALITVLSFHASNPKEHEWIADTVREIVKEHIPLYLQGKSFLFDKY